MNVPITVHIADGAASLRVGPVQVAFVELSVKQRQQTDKPDDIERVAAEVLPTLLRKAAAR